MDTRTFTYPSAELPGLSPFSIDVPQGWEAEPAPRTIAAFVEQSDGDFRSNMILNGERVLPNMSLAEVAEASAAADRSDYTDYELVEQQETEIDGLPAIVQLQRFSLGAESTKVSQLRVVLYAPIRDDRVVELFTLHGTCEAEQEERLAPVFSQTFRSLKFAA